MEENGRIIQSDPGLLYSYHLYQKNVYIITYDLISKKAV